MGVRFIKSDRFPSTDVTDLSGWNVRSYSYSRAAMDYRAAVTYRAAICAVRLLTRSQTICND